MDQVITSNSDATTTSTNGDATVHHHHDGQLQMDVGTYVGYQANIPVLELYVERDPGDPYNTGRSIEHWGLYTTYQWPGTGNRDYTVQYKYALGQDPSAADFRARIRQITGITYIQAACQKMVP